MEPLLSEILTLLAINFAITIGAVTLLWLISIPIRDASIIDMAFPGLLMGIAAASYFIGNGVEQRKLLILTLVGIWGLRLTVHLVGRNWGHGEDVRYTKLRSWVKDDRAFIWLSLRKVFLLQGVVVWIASLPIQVAMVYTQPATLGWIAIAGSLLWLLGFGFETIADMQLKKFRADPSKSGTVLQSGLWRYSRHPNYFGELCVWWGLFLIACDNPLALITIVGPLFYSHIVINLTGQRTLDKKLSREKPGYQEYMDSTSGLLPRPPRSRST